MSRYTAPNRPQFDYSEWVDPHYPADLRGLGALDPNYNDTLNAHAYVGIDFETYSDVDIRKHGAYRYMETPNFQPLMVTFYVDPNLLFCDCVSDLVDRFEALVTSGKMIPRYGGILYSKGYVILLNDGKGEGYEALYEVLYHIHKAGPRHHMLAAHNATFERLVLDWLNYPSWVADLIVDTASIARAAGAAGSLFNAARQLLSKDKMESGINHIKTFCVPNEKFDLRAPMLDDIVQHQDPTVQPEFEDFTVYGVVDAVLAENIAREYEVTAKAHVEELATYRMNLAGWPVDIPLVVEMNQRFETNCQDLLEEFYDIYEPSRKLNLNSNKQLKEWCAARGINAKSFSKEAVETLLPLVERRIVNRSTGIGAAIRLGWEQVLAMLTLKQDLGGSSLKKLPTILDMVSVDGRLRGQYLHTGAGQTERTSGTGVQMQSLPRLGRSPIHDIEDLHNPANYYSNHELSENLRQVFRGATESTVLAVGDYSSVESRGLAFLAGAEWKLEAFRNGQDLYKVQAASIFNVKYADVTPEQRHIGKIGELSCGYGAGGGAVHRFASKMGTDMTEQEAVSLVKSWRAANPEIVEFWDTLDTLIHTAVTKGMTQSHILFSKARGGLRIEVNPYSSPASLQAIHPGVQSLYINIRQTEGGGFLGAYEPRMFMERVIHGVYSLGGSLYYYKPTTLRSGPAWQSSYIHPVTKKRTKYSIYGGKLAGILTQSFCRELFFEGLVSTQDRLASAPAYGRIQWPDDTPRPLLVGQFHDELALEADLGYTTKNGQTPQTQVLEVTQEWVYAQTVREAAMKNFLAVEMTRSPYRIIQEYFPLEAAAGVHRNYIK